MVLVVVKLMGRSRKAIREGSAVEGAKEVGEDERLNHEDTYNALHVKSDDRGGRSG